LGNGVPAPEFIAGVNKNRRPCVSQAEEHMFAARERDVINAPLEQEFEQLFHDHYPLVYRTAYSVTGNREDAEDVVQTIFLRLYRRGEWSGLKENPKAYLYRAAVNTAVSVVRSRRKHILTDDPVELDRPVEAKTSNEEPALQGRFLEAISRLNPSAIEILILRYEHNYSDAEIAKLLGTSRGAIAVRLFRARARLKKFMEKKS
jgi:RNA polymerase sigma-70 factor (ECF subfamily)